MDQQIAGSMHVCCSSSISSRAMTPSRLSGEWRCDKRHGQGVCRFSDGTRFRGEWENDAWLQYAADPALSKVVGLTDALAGHHSSFTIQVQPCHLYSLCTALVQSLDSLCSLISLCSLCSFSACTAFTLRRSCG